MRLINADMLRDKLKEIAHDRFNLSDEYGWFLKGLMVADDEISEMPTIDPQKYGRWLWDDKHRTYYCTECLFYAFGDNIDILNGRFQYCPSCAAKMRGFDNEDYD